MTQMMRSPAATEAARARGQAIRNRIDREQSDLRKGIRAARREFGHKQNGTVQTHAHAARVRQGAIARLFEAGAIDRDQLAASQEIAAIYRRIVGDVTIGCVSLEARVDCGRRHDAAFFESLGAVRREVAYSRWRARIDLPDLVLAVVVEDIGISVAARRWGMRNARARRIVGDALDLWNTLVGEACRDIDEATLLAAQAGILG